MPKYKWRFLNFPKFSAYRFPKADRLTFRQFEYLWYNGWSSDSGPSTLCLDAATSRALAIAALTHPDNK
jgi:hypothetical protein